jgi:hypothetical protein
VSETVFGAALPAVAYAEDTTGLTVGTQFVPTVDGTITAVRLYTSSPAPLDPIDWKLLSATGATVLASGTWSVGQPGGTWIEATFAPVPVVANTTYVVAAGVLKRYVASNSFFDVPKGSTHLTAPQGAGHFTLSAGWSFPTTLYANSGYFVDVAFTPSSTAPPVTPSVTLGPIWAFGDPLIGTLAVLRDAVAPNGAVPTWGTIPPPTAATGAPTLPYGVVASDGELSKTAADASATVRVTVWAATAEQARALAGWARALLLASHGDGATVRHYGRATGLLPTTDPSGRYPVCSFTVAARLLPVSI